MALVEVDAPRTRKWADSTKSEPPPPMLELAVYSAGAAASARTVGEAAAEDEMTRAAVEVGREELKGGTEERLRHAWGAAEARIAHCARRRERTCPLAILRATNVTMKERMVVNVVDGWHLVGEVERLIVCKDVSTR